MAPCRTCGTELKASWKGDYYFCPTCHEELDRETSARDVRHFSVSIAYDANKVSKTQVLGAIYHKLPLNSAVVASVEER